MPLSSIKRRKVHFKPLKKVKCFHLCKLLLAALPTIIFGVFTIVFTLQQDASAKATREQDQRQAEEINRRTIFKEYIDDVTELLLGRDYNASIKQILLHIRVQTLTVLQHLDVNRKRDVITFLYENHLLRSDQTPTVDLRGANLNDLKFWSSSTVACHLPHLYLPGVYAEKIIFDGCSLFQAIFDNSSMSFAQFLSCSLSQTSFQNTNLTGTRFRGDSLYGVNFTSAHLVQSTVIGGFLRNMTFMNIDLYQSKLSEELLCSSKNNGSESNIFLNTRCPDGSFSRINGENQFLNHQTSSTSQCYRNTHLYPTSFPLSMDVTPRPEIKPSINKSDCFVLTEQNASAVLLITTQQFSVLIDQEQALFNFSVLLGFKNATKNSEMSIKIHFIDDGGISDNDHSLSMSRMNVSFFHVEFLVNSIPAKTRSLLVILSCTFVEHSDQFCVFNDLNLFILEKTSAKLSFNY